ncbi:Immunoglobulin V-set domain [Trinorchestia longiramus]|nr:Immunoglobulin V-set domain [Trinorchestia longiramus]
MSVIGGEVLLPCSPHPHTAAVTAPRSPAHNFNPPYSSPLSYTPSSSSFIHQNILVSKWQSRAETESQVSGRTHRSVWTEPQFTFQYFNESQFSSAPLTYFSQVSNDILTHTWSHSNSDRKTDPELTLRRVLRSTGLEQQRRPVPPTRRGPSSALMERHRAQFGRGSKNRAFVHQSRKPHLFGQQPDQPILVLWYKDGLGTPIYSFDNRSSTARIWTDIDLLGRRASFNVTQGVLLINDLLPSDEGVYRCRVDYRNAATSITRTNLTVIVPPNTPVIKDGLGHAAADGLPTYSEGEPLSLVCTVRGGRPRPTVRWYLGATLMDDSYETPELGVTSNSLHVQAVDRRLASADLRCVAAVPQTMPVHAAVTLSLNRESLLLLLSVFRIILQAEKTVSL